MTAESSNSSSSGSGSDEKTSANEKIKTNTIPTDILEICEFLSKKNGIIFKSQQIDDPELQRTEKIDIAYEIYARSKQTFLNRFGAHLEERHLRILADMLSENDDDEEVEMMLMDFQRKLETRKLDVKNRRYAALQQLIQKGEYFSELEMMKRAPELYQDLVGQYLSDEEKKERDGYDLKNTTFSGILIHTMQQREMQDILNEADRNNKCKDANYSDNVEDEEDKLAVVRMPLKICNDDNVEEQEEEDEGSVAENRVLEIYEVPVSCRQQWGNFDDEKVACSTSKCTKITKPVQATTVPKDVKFITSGERELLRQEFVGLMHENFLAGLDKEFDYTEVDNNSQLDDLRQLDQDKEDAYFEESDDDIDQQSKCDAIDESEDELDIYMSHLQKHHHLQH